MRRAPPKKSKRKKRPKQHGFETYIPRILKKLHPDSGINTNAKKQLNSVLETICKEVASEAVSLTKSANKRTVTPTELELAIRAKIPGELVRHALTEGERATTKIRRVVQVKGSRSLAARAEIEIPPSRVRKFFNIYDLRISRDTSVYLAAVLQYLAGEILELAGNAAREAKKVRISVRDLYLAMVNDEELCELMKRLGIELSGGGVTPMIHSKLLKKPKRKGKRTKKAPGAPHRFRPGTRAIFDIRKYQKQSNCTYFTRAGFDRVVREILQNYKDDVRVSADAVIYLQFYIEQYLVSMLSDANDIVVNCANRQRMGYMDLRVARRIREGRC